MKRPAKPGRLLLLGVAIGCLTPLQASAQRTNLDDEILLAMPYFEPLPPSPGTCRGTPPAPVDRQERERRPTSAEPFAQPSWSLPPPMLHGLRLTPAQEDKVFAIQYALLPNMREQAKAAAKLAVALRGYAFGPGYDEAGLQALVDAEAKATAALMQMRIRADHRIFELLTPEQRQQLMADEHGREDAPTAPPDVPPPPPGW